jgi:hypothetical protein
MRTARTVLAALLVGSLAACGDAAETGEETAAPDYEIVEDDDQGTIVAEVDSLPDPSGLEAIFAAVRDDNDSKDGSYSLGIDCSTGGTWAAANRLASGRFGDLGAAQTGLQDGASEFEVNDDRTCPVVLDEAAPDSPTAEEVVTAFDEAELAVSDPRDNSGGCSSLRCAQLVRTEDVSVYIFADDQARAAFTEAAGDNAHVDGDVVLSYTAARTPDEDRAEYERVLAGLDP